ncbi:hypothetical protein SAMN06265379_103354 [Saccharicrinis carchari]|uniref:Sugar-phosphatase n=1 Tax=Saccharicrinis carchari TaxID=1168039 RepID=A0A521CNP7_SACCC|nr:HAD family hydrolase [Saccharicrinis carchari]SMO61084.1 hypothetical protein SAMN06265379_103354 [Saccharicrinis carchari]
MIKLIVTDMDGTLLNSNKELSPKFESIYKQLRDKGIRFAVASGRPHYSLRPQFEHFTHDIIFIGDNGAYIGTQPEPLISGSFTNSEMDEIINTYRKIAGVDAVICTPHKPYTESDDADFIKKAKKYYPNIEMVDEAKKINEQVLKVAICDSLTWQENSGKIWNRFEEKHVVAPSSNVWIDLMPLGVNKGAAVAHIQQLLGVKKEETMVFGDFHNDIEMLQMASHSYAMENAHEDVKNVAQFIAPSNDSNGVIQVIEEVVLKH